MNDRFLKATGMSLAAFLALLFANRDTLATALGAFPEFVVRLTESLPFGAWSTLLALGESMAAWCLAMHYFPQTRDARRPQFAADLMAILTGIAVTLSQAIGGSVSDQITALWLGLGAGMAAPPAARFIGSLKRAARVPTDPPKESSP